MAVLSARINHSDKFDAYSTLGLLCSRLFVIIVLIITPLFLHVYMFYSLYYHKIFTVMMVVLSAPINHSDKFDAYCTLGLLCSRL